jgi:hypothetical protein
VNTFRYFVIDGSRRAQTTPLLEIPDG